MVNEQVRIDILANMDIKQVTAQLDKLKAKAKLTRKLLEKMPGGDTPLNRKAIANQERAETKALNDAQRIAEKKAKIAKTNKELREDIKEMPKIHSKEGAALQAVNTTQIRTTRGLRKHKAALDNAAHSASKFKMEYLGIMFGGMALQRAFGGVIKKIFVNFKELTKGSVNPLSVALTRLEANVKFLQFSLIDAAGPWIIKLADGLAALALSLAKTDPSLLRAVAAAIALLAGAGFFMATVGQGVLLWQSLKLVNQNLAKTDVNKANDAASAFTRLKNSMSGKAGDKTLWIIPKVKVPKIGPLGWALLAVEAVGYFTNSFNSEIEKWAEEQGGTTGFLVQTFADILATIANLTQILFKGIFEEIKRELGIIGKVLEFLFNVKFSSQSFIDSMESMRELSALMVEGLSLREALNKMSSDKNQPLPGLFSSDPNMSIDPSTISSVENYDNMMSKLSDAPEEVKPSLEMLEAARLVAETTPAALESMGTAITEELVPAFDKLNIPLAESKDNLGDLNTETLTNMTRIEQIAQPMIDDTGRRQNNADAINNQADAQERLNEAISESNEGADEGV